MHTTHDNTILWVAVIFVVLLLILGSGYRSRSYSNENYSRTPSTSYQTSSTLSAGVYNSTVISGNAIRLQSGQICNRALYQSEGVCVAMQ